VYVIVTYDVAEERVQKVLKFLRKHLRWVQNSVFEGYVSEKRLEAIKDGLKKLIDERHDSIHFYKLPHRKTISRRVIGIRKGATEGVV